MRQMSPQFSSKIDNGELNKKIYIFVQKSSGLFSEILLNKI
jgi:hypothetical protein